MTEISNSLFLKLCGTKTEKSVEEKIRAIEMVRDQPKILLKVRIERNICGNFIID